MRCSSIGKERVFFLVTTAVGLDRIFIRCGAARSLPLAYRLI